MLIRAGVGVFIALAILVPALLFLGLPIPSDPGWTREAVMQAGIVYAIVALTLAIVDHGDRRP